MGTAFPEVAGTVVGLTDDGGALGWRWHNLGSAVSVDAEELTVAPCVGLAASEHPCAGLPPLWDGAFSQVGEAWLIRPDIFGLRPW